MKRKNSSLNNRLRVNESIKATKTMQNSLNQLLKPLLPQPLSLGSGGVIYFHLKSSARCLTRKPTVREYTACAVDQYVQAVISIIAGGRSVKPVNVYKIALPPVKMTR